jgi:hypothetical protein
MNNQSWNKALSRILPYWIVVLAVLWTFTFYLLWVSPEATEKYEEKISTVRLAPDHVKSMMTKMVFRLGNLNSINPYALRNSLIRFLKSASKIKMQSLGRVRFSVS